MKKYSIAGFLIIIIVVSVYFVISNKKEERTKDETKKVGALNIKEDQKNVSQQWMATVWRNVTDLVQEQRSFKTEGITSAAVRGIKRGGKIYLRESDIKNAIKVLEQKLKKKPDPKLKYYLAQCYSKIENNEKAAEYYKDIVENHSKSRYVEPAKKELEKLNK